MTLTLGTGPFAKPTSGWFNFDLASAAPAHVLYLEDVPKRVRGVINGQTVVDSRRAKLLHETGLLPVWYFPLADLRPDLLAPTDHSTHCPFKGDASYWTLTVGDRVEENVVWGYPAPLQGAPPLAGLVAFYGDRVDTWFEEDEEILGHPRDPYHRVDTRASSDHVVVRVGGEVVADSTQPVKVFETGLPPRWYLPQHDVRQDLLTPTDTSTICPYKGVASYWTVRAGGVTAVDAVWSYQEPLGEALGAAGYLSFLHDDAEVTVT